MQEPRAQQQRAIRTLFVSDVHLGCRYAQAENFLDFLNGVVPERIYIVGDFIDGWNLKSAWNWKVVYTRIVNRLLTLASNGTKLFYTPGNHDSFLRCLEVKNIVERGGVNLMVQDEFICEGLNGKRYLVLHGDQFDVVEQRYRWVSLFCSVLYKPLLAINGLLSRLVRGRRHNPYPLCAGLKSRAKALVRRMSHFEERLFEYTRNRGCDGIICGHIHCPGAFEGDRLVYYNTGDWVENCTALVENTDGSFVLEWYFPNKPDRLLSGPVEPVVHDEGPRPRPEPVGDVAATP